MPGRGRRTPHNEWQATEYNIDDPKNLGTADINYWVVKGNVGATEKFTRNGGATIRTRRIGSALKACDPATTIKLPHPENKTPARPPFQSNLKDTMQRSPLKNIRASLLALLLLASFAAPGRAAGQAEPGLRRADVLVYGATPGGVCAAIAAAREGATVLLLEPTRHVGGLTAGGLSHCDSNQMMRDTVMGLFHEWHTRVVKDYTDRGLKKPYDPAVKDQSLWTFSRTLPCG